MAVQTQALIRDQIVDRRHKLQGAVELLGQRPELLDLLAQVDAALSRIELGTFGLCETCHDPIESDRILADPLVRVCLDHLTPNEQRALEQDLELAAQIQRGLLPDVTLAPRQWEIAYHYEPARVVSGDYCDVAAADGVLHFMLGDVSGKGVAASMLMANLHAMMRALISVPMPLEQLLERASRTFCESTLPMHYATMVCGRLTDDGWLEIGNAGHLPPVIARNSGVSLVKATGMPVGMFCAESFTVERVRLEAGEMIVLYTDGVTEAEDADQRQYGIDRLTALVQERRALTPQALVDACIGDLRAHRGPRRQDDDVTILAIRRGNDQQPG